MSWGEICENTKMGREYALLGNYDTALVYYQGVIQQIQKLVVQIKEPARKQKWQEVRQMIVQEYEHVKDISQTLANFKKDTVQYGGMRHGHEEPTRDPDVWPPPTPVERENRYGLELLSYDSAVLFIIVLYLHINRWVSQWRHTLPVNQ